MILLYNLGFILFGLWYLPFFLLKIRQAEHPQRLIRQRLGLFDAGFREKIIGKKIVWIHAVSVGETLAVERFIQEFLETGPEYHVVLSTVTPTGQKVAKKLESDRVTLCYFPFDLTFAVRRFLTALDPECLLLVETEIWPNLLSEARHAKIPVGILNARLSGKSARRYCRFRGFFRHLFECLDFVLVQTPLDGERFAAAGTPVERIRVLGNMKFDREPSPVLSRASVQSLREEWGFKADDLILVAGSTHPGEEKILSRIYEDLKPRYPARKRLLAPRHRDRSVQLARYLKRKGLHVRLASQAAAPAEFDVVILNQLGILKHLYAIADVVFVGGSLIRHGGQNPIEPAHFKRPIFHGPFVGNFEYIYRMLDKEGGAIVVQDQEQLSFALGRVLRNHKEARDLGENAYRVVTQLRGATQRHVEWLMHFLRSRLRENPGERGVETILKTDYAHLR
jgi:3-deoxy-D-manno-octulosonic-acid transferase